MKKVVFIVLAALVFGGVYFYKNEIMGCISMLRVQMPAASAESNSLGNPENENGQKVLVAFFLGAVILEKLPIKFIKPSAEIFLKFVR